MAMSHLGLSQKLTHEGIRCGGCRQVPIIGIRFKCLRCDDFDFCEDCYRIKSCHEDTHEFRGRVTGEDRSHEKTYGVFCDGCRKSPMVGKYYRCQECRDFDLCRTCFRIVEHRHTFRKMLRNQSVDEPVFEIDLDNKNGKSPKNKSQQQFEPEKLIEEASEELYYIPDEIGYFLIFSNGNFSSSSGCSNLSAANKKDVEALKEVFGQLLNFHIRIFNDKEEDDIMDVLNYYACKDHSAYGCFGCIFLSHGGNGYVCDQQGNEIPLGKIFEKFRGKNMKNIPKLFFFDLCRSGPRAADYPVLDCGFNTLYAYACSEGDNSYCTNDGSQYTTTLCKVIKERYHRKVKREIMTIMRVVNNKMEQKSKEGNYQCPAPITTLTRQLFLY